MMLLSPMFGRIALLAWMTALVTSCSNNTSCDDCLEEECVWVPVAGCLESCDVIADTACFDLMNYPENTVEEVCALVEAAGSDSALCGMQDDCESCVSTTISDGKTCQWFSQDSYCSSACGMNGCGDTVCSADPNITLPMNDCGDYETCGDCLAETCAWTPSEGCLESCDIIADTSCFSPSNSTDIESICSAADEGETNQELCMAQTDCGSCVNTLLSDDITSCQWFEDGAYCSSACGMDGCGTMTCSINPTPSPSSGNAIIAPLMSLLLAVVSGIAAIGAAL